MCGIVGEVKGIVGVEVLVFTVAGVVVVVCVFSVALLRLLHVAQ